MWKMIPGPIRRWLFLVVLLPLAAWGLDASANEIAERRGETTATRAMRAPGAC